jgi:Cu/Ag efflux pump CusA
MIPMALGFGDGGEQNAPLGRAVIGGLLCATVATSFLCRRCLVFSTADVARFNRYVHDETMGTAARIYIMEQ